MDNELRFFLDNGYMGPFKVYEPEDARRRLRAIRAKNLDRSRALFDNDANYDRHFDISELTEHISHPEIVKRLRKIIGHNLLCWRTEFFPKFPGARGTEWHQVEKFQYTTGIPQLSPTREKEEGLPMELTAWTVFTESNTENGCLKFLPGSHKQLYYDETKIPTVGRGEYSSLTADTPFFGYNFEDFKIDQTWKPDETQARAMIMNPGECVIFTARCIHGSYPNTSKHSTRFAITNRYVPSHVRVYADQTGFVEHGSKFDLTNHGCVLVSGTDEFGHNRIRTHNNLGEPFRTVPPDTTTVAYPPSPRAIGGQSRPAPDAV
jgi:non-heme Fe2+,alpha-ketoglutarate-dependent halogenase